ncbi:uracil-DNA glycosylase [Loigolactobacillus binensis]|uniref:Uracil-DNA glycosylase n=1 Tax=Loigolactobacillus binensis TaxID=2559922 RepID=A0ABW3EB18_9LACO|nr:uracil-DNA glycosylase [Loigolactobacillus binensis]
MTDEIFPNGWDQPLKQIATAHQWQDLIALKQAADQYYCDYGDLLTPSRTNLYRALELTAFTEVKVVLLGQDPYPSGDKATGLAFSVGQTTHWRRDSLAAIADLLASDGYGELTSGDLSPWAQQGVLLLNLRLTHRNTAAGHTKTVDRTLNWPLLTRLMIRALNERTAPVAFILWGKDAITMEKYIHASQHLLVRASHPSQMSRRRTLFKGKVSAFDRSQSFQQVNAWLQHMDQPLIDWTGSMAK